MTNDLQAWLRHDRSPGFYKEYPALFTSYFPNLEREAVAALSEAGYYYYHAMLIYDEIVDEQKTEDIAVMMALHSESLRILGSLFGYNSPFWEFWNQRNSSQHESLEYSLHLGLQPEVTFAQFRELAQLKASTALLGIDGLFVLSDSQMDRPPDFLDQSHAHFYAGLQLYDDIKDFQKDWGLSQFNWAIYAYESTCDLESDKSAADHHKTFFLNGQADQLLGKAQDEFRAALACLPLHEESGWAELCQRMTQVIGGYRGQLKGYIECLKAKQYYLLTEEGSPVLPDPVNSMDETGERAWFYLQKCSQRGWFDLPHWMWLSSEEGFQCSGVHRAEVFQRSLLYECLSFGLSIEVEEWRKFLIHEWTILKGLKSDQGVGCWSYFPKSIEIAPDIDDLAQVMIFLLRAGKSDLIEAYCGTGLEVATNQRRLETGVWETWIVPVVNRTPLEQKQEWFNTTYWGRGPDVEVVANFAYALYCWKPQRYEIELEGTVDYIIKQQDVQGFWPSRWYCGHLYGTYQCVRLLRLKKMKSDHQVLMRARDFVLGLQGADGGFGMSSEASSDPLSTAFAILIIRLMDSKADFELDRAKNYLRHSQCKDGSWRAVHFIMAKPSELYKSAVLTTAWVLKALYDISQ